MKVNSQVQPQVGESVAVRVCTERTNDGTPTMTGRITRDYQTLQTVQAVYSDGSVRTCTGDVWNVTRTDKGLLAVA